ncbi:hypothetical protein [Tepidibacter hydrothermalis]|uniref:Uncharacterized protein n=1 Tax=Tepidibacter hydrothermalis TaxID=3036126 RepID=A0ABY8E8X5_9FIRM|nr:hypothetical protein [Tepidibacter hydrothermalis]WFD09365.1 hypothetical protein P4S50_13330 [Tepidibacter hydrothermalis]
MFFNPLMILKSYENSYRQDQKNIDYIIKGIENDFPNMYNQGMNNNIVTSLLRFIVNYVQDNRYKYKGTKEEKADYLLKDLNKEHSWLFFILSIYGIEYKKIYRFLKRIIILILSYTEKPTPVYDIQKEIRRITNIIRDTTNIFNRLEKLGVPRNEVRSIVRRVVAFTLRSIDIYNPPLDIQQTSQQILRNLIRSNTGVIRDIRYYGITIPEVRPILRRIIRITLRNISYKNKY